MQNDQQSPDQRQQYDPAESDVVVTFIDGEVKTYRIMAGPTLSRFLAQQAGETGILTLLNGAATYNIPVNQIREYSIERVRREGGA